MYKFILIVTFCNVFIRAMAKSGNLALLTGHGRTRSDMDGSGAGNGGVIVGSRRIFLFIRTRHSDYRFLNLNLKIIAFEVFNNSSK